ncbi:MAG: hypothetical protein ABIQ93_04785 [Saprospiraceae bacterium]
MTKSKNFLPSAPTQGLWLAAVIIGLLGVLTHFVPVGELSRYSYWMLLIGFLLLVVGTTYRRV